MIRNITEEDLSVCANLLQAAYGKPPYNENFVGDNAYKYILEKYNNCKNDSFVSVEGNEILGFIFLRLSTWSVGSQAILEEIVVNPANQNNGVGTALMAHAQEYLKARGVRSAMLWTKKDKRLLDFYEKRGYSLADDFVVMFKNC